MNECCICGKEAKKVWNGRFYCVTCLPSNFGKDLKEEVKYEYVWMVVDAMSKESRLVWREALDRKRWKDFYEGEVIHG